MKIAPRSKRTSRAPQLASWRLQDLSWRQVQKLVPAKVDTIILPVGTVEAHGATCIGTDNYIPDSIAESIAPQIHALVAPIVNHGITRSLYSYPGATTVQPETFKRYISEILISFKDSGFRNVIILNGHGGNNSVLKDVALEINHGTKLNIAVIHWWEMCDEVTKEFFGESGAHAGVDETAMVMAINPKLAYPAEYSADMIYTFGRGADVYPVPGTILNTKAGEGKPQFNAVKAKKYHALICAKVAEFAKFVLKRWRDAGLG